MAWDSYTKLMLHFNGADASTIFTDEIGHTFTPHGNAQIDTAQSKFGGASGLFDGTGDYLTTPDNADWNFGSGDFTIDFWVRLNSVTATQVFCGDYTGSTHRSWIVYFTPNQLHFAYSTNGSNNTDTGKAWTPSANTWYHIAIVRYGNTITWYVDGSSIGTLDVTGITLQWQAGYVLYIAQEGNGSYTNGWLDELRISKGIARWTANFTPPTGEYEAGAAVYIPRHSGTVGVLIF